MSKDNIVGTTVGVAVVALLAVLIVGAFKYVASHPGKPLIPCQTKTIQSVQFSVGGVNHELYYVTFTDGSSHTYQDPRYTPSIGQSQCEDYWGY